MRLPEIDRDTPEANFLSFRDHGDEASLERCVGRVQAELLRVARHYARSADEAEDCVQQTFVTAIERAHTFQAGRRLQPWLIGILLKTLAKQRERRSPLLADLEGETRPQPEPVAHMVDAEVSELVHSALDKLPDAYREVLEMHLDDGAQGSEIARRLERSPGTVRSQIHRGLRLLRELLPASLAMGLMGLFTRPARAVGARRSIPGTVQLAGAVAMCAGTIGWFAFARVEAAPRGANDAAPKVAELDDVQSKADFGEPARRASFAAPIESAAIPGGPATPLIRVRDPVTGAALPGTRVQAQLRFAGGARVETDTRADSEGVFWAELGEDTLTELSVTATLPGHVPVHAHWDGNQGPIVRDTPWGLPLHVARPIGGTVGRRTRPAGRRCRSPLEPLGALGRIDVARGKRRRCCADRRGWALAARTGAHLSPTPLAARRPSGVPNRRHLQGSRRNRARRALGPNPPLGPRAKRQALRSAPEGRVRATDRRRRGLAHPSPRAGSLGRTLSDRSRRQGALLSAGLAAPARLRLRTGLPAGLQFPQAALRG